MNHRVRVHNRSNSVSPCSFPAMKVLTLILVLTPIVLANQNLAAVKSPPVFITADARPSILEPTSPTDELFENRFDHIKTEWMQNNPYSLRVFVTEGTNNRYDYINSTDNPDEINSVKNRKHKHSTAEYLNGESELHEGTHHLFPILLRILVGFNNNNNNTDANFIAFKLPSSLAQGYQLTDTVLLLTTMISMFYMVEFAVVIETLYGERRDSHTAPISGEHLFHHDPTYDREDDGPFVSITDIIIPGTDDATSFDAANNYAVYSFADSDILPCFMHYCQPLIDASNNDGGGLWKMSSTPKSALISPPLDAMCWIDSNHFLGMARFSSSISCLCAIMSTPDMIKSTTIASFPTHASIQPFLHATLLCFQKNNESTPYVMVTSWRIHLLPASNNPTQKMFYSNTQYGSEESSFIKHQPSMWTFLDGHAHLSYVIEQGRFKSLDFDAGEHVSYTLPTHYVMYHNFLEHHYFHRRTLATVINRSVLKLFAAYSCRWRCRMLYIIMRLIMGSTTISSHDSSCVVLKLLHDDIFVSQVWRGDTIHHYRSDLRSTLSHSIFGATIRSATSCSPSRYVGSCLSFDHYFAYKDIQDIVSFEFWKKSTSTHQLNQVFLLWRGTSCASCTSSVSNDAVLLVEDINLALPSGEFSMHQRTSTSMSPFEFNVDLCLANNVTLLIIDNDVRTINISSCVASLVIGELLSENTHHLRCLRFDVLTTGTIRHHNTPSYSSSLTIIYLRDLAVITNVFLGDSHLLRRIFLSWGATLPNLLAVLIICVLQHDLLSYKTIITDDGKFYAISIVDWEDGDTSSLDVCDHDTAWGAVDKSPSIVFNTSSASTAMFCTSATYTTILLRRLLPLSTRLLLFEVFLVGRDNDSFDSEIPSQLSSLCCLYMRTTLETGEHVSSVSIKRPSCTSPVNGERFICGLDNAIYVNFVQDTVVTTDNHSLFGVYENHTQQLMKQRHFCADDTVSTSMQQLMNSAYCSSQEQNFRSVAMSVSYANLHASIASINVSLGLFDVTDNAVTAELQDFAIRRDLLPDGHEDTSFGIGSRTFCAMDYIIASYRLNLPTLVEPSKFSASGNTSHRHTSTCGVEFSKVDVLRERWRYHSNAGLGIFFGSILLLQRVMGSNSFHTVNSGISISSRRGVTDNSVYTDSLPICTHMGTF